ncbi:hypothetical protein KW786_03420 [Candidatus Parcubacteria bacterium]|nr:hypothetical protein [Candidatus Parcubacteria bacterium]
MSSYWVMTISPNSKRLVKIDEFPAQTEQIAATEFLRRFKEGKYPYSSSTLRLLKAIACVAA